MQAAPDGSEHLVVVIRYLIWVGDEAAHEAAERVLHSVVDAQRSDVRENLTS
ncbi:MAG TPA: hypothetical protein VF794_41495 [Archangium sp.]|uniref:hypothetical protein n=1 Tax=Archangium sp. TaxID=1872627 RepID=UPI002EDB1EED